MGLPWALLLWCFDINDQCYNLVAGKDTFHSGLGSPFLYSTPT